MSLKKESPRHSTAFAYYLQLGGKRSYPQVARQFSVSVTSVKKWAKSFEWERRIAEADAKANCEQQKSSEEGYIRNVEDFRTLKLRTLTTLKSRVDAGSCSVMELIQVLRVVKTELGEPWQITKQPPDPSRPNPFERILEAVLSQKSEEHTL